MKEYKNMLTIREYIEFIADELNDIMLMNTIEAENELIKATKDNK